MARCSQHIPGVFVLEDGEGRVPLSQEELCAALQAGVDADNIASTVRADIVAGRRHPVSGARITAPKVGS